MTQLKPIIIFFALVLSALPFIDKAALHAQDAVKPALKKAKLTAISVKGNVSMKADAILKNLPVKAGDTIEYEPLGNAQIASSTPCVPDFKKQLIQNPFFNNFKDITFELQPYLDSYKLEITVTEFPKISSLQFTGNTKFSSDELLKVIPLKIGDPFNKTLLKEASKKIEELYKNKGFLGGLHGFMDEDGVQFNEQDMAGGALKLNVDEVKIEEIRLEGNEIVDAAEIRLNILEKTDELFDFLKVDDDIKRLQKLDYFKNIAYSYKKGSAPNKIILTLSFVEKWGTVVESVELKGNETVSREMLMSCLSLKPGDPLKKDSVQADIKAIEALGYFSFVTPSFHAGGTGAIVTYEVKENPRIKSVTLEGNSVLPSEKILSVIKTNSNLPLNFNLLADDVKRIRMLYQKNGYILGEVAENTIDILEGRAADLRLKLYEGWIEDIRIEGEKEEEVATPGGKEAQLKKVKLHTKEYVIRREMTLKPGMIFNENILQKDLQKIRNLSPYTQLFESIDPKLEAGTKPNAIILTIVLREVAQTGTALFGAGYSSQTSWSGTASISKDNLFGKARRLKLDLTFGGVSSYSIDYYEPWLDKKHTSLDLALFRELIRRRNRVVDSKGVETIAIYDQRRSGFGLTLGRPIQEFTRVYLGIQSEKIKINSVDVKTPLPSNISSLEGDKRSLTVSVVKDTRDDVFDATKGVRDSLDLEFSGAFLGGSINFKKYTLEMRRYFKLGFTKFTYATRLQLGLYTGDDIFPQQYFVGGTDTIRGYPDYFYVGSRMLVFNHELRYKISNGMTVVLFTDIGNAWPLNQPLKSNDIKVGTGLGIRFKTPIGPIRLDYGYGLKRKESQLHFNIGPMF